MADTEKIVERLFGSAGGETAIRHRSGLVTAVPAAGFVDVERVGNGIPVLAGNWLEVGDVAHCLVWSGGAIAIGRTGLDTQGPKGVLAYAQRGSVFDGVTSQVPIPGLEVTFTVPAGRLVRISAEGRMTAQSDGGCVVVRMFQGTTQRVVVGDYTAPSTQRREPFSRSRVIEPTAGEHTYHLTLELFSGPGSAGITASGSDPSFILAEDIGPA